MPVESELERGARMKSVGILSPSYTLLYRYMHFLENQVRCVPSGRGLAAPCPGEVTFPRWRAVLGESEEFGYNSELQFPGVTASTERVTGPQREGNKELLSSSLFIANRPVRCYPNPAYFAGTKVSRGEVREQEIPVFSS